MEEALRLALLAEQFARWNAPLPVTEVGAYFGGDDIDQERELGAWCSDEEIEHGTLYEGGAQRGGPNPTRVVALEASRHHEMLPV